MMGEYELFGDSFRALSAEKLGISVLELCADDDIGGRTQLGADDWAGESEKEQ